MINKHEHLIVLPPTHKSRICSSSFVATKELSAKYQEERTKRKETEERATRLESYNKVITNTGKRSLEQEKAKSDVLEEIFHMKSVDTRYNVLSSNGGNTHTNTHTNINANATSNAFDLSQKLGLSDDSIDDAKMADSPHKWSNDSALVSELQR